MGQANRSTPLIPLARTGFFQFHSKSPTFNDGIALRKKIGTNSTLDWIEETGWAPGSQVFQELEEIQSELGENGVLQYDASFAPLFRSLVDRAYEEGGEAFKKIYDMWSKQPDGRDKSRSEFEILCENVFGQSRQQIRDAMSPINSVNHYAYVISMRKLTETRNELPLVETSELVSFNGITDAVTGDHQRYLSDEKFNELLDSHALDIVRRTLHVPVDLFGEPKNWEKLASFASMDASLQSDFQSLKQSVLREVFRLIDPKVSVSPSGLEKACKEYSRLLCSELGLPSSKLASVGMKLHLNKLPGAGVKTIAGDILSSAAGAAVASAIGGDPYSGSAAGYGAKKAGEFLFNQMVNVTLDVNADDLSYYTRRQFDRFYSPLSGKREYEEHIGPIASALAVKGLSADVRRAETNDEVIAVLDKTQPDLF